MSDAPPFATANGRPTNPTGGSSGAHDFVTNPKSNSPATGQRDFTKESRAQTMGSPPVNPAEIPAGGQVLKADPTGLSACAPSGGVQGVAHKPFRLKGEGAASTMPAPSEPAAEPEAGSTGDESY